jgi:hypothetical protein
MKTQGIRVGLKLISTVAAVACIISIILSLTGRWQFIGLPQNPKPKCDCWFPQDNKYGVQDKRGGCKIKDCDPPKAPPRVNTKVGAGVVGTCQHIIR